MSVPNKKRNVEKTSDPATLLAWFDELSDGSEDLIFSDDSEGEEDNLVLSDHHSVSEQEISEDEEEEVLCDDGNERYFLGKDKATKWLKQKPPTNIRTRAHNIITHLPGPRNGAQEINSEGDLFRLFFDDNVIRIITSCTNIYIEKVRPNFGRDRDARNTDETEIRAVLGLLYLMGTMRSSRKNTHQMWDNSKGNGLESCYLSMSEQRFRFLLRCLRFDDVRDRHLRKEIDKLAPIREVFEIIVHNFQKYFSPSEYLTVDEQLLAFRGNCPFRQFIPSKPAKYGLKTFALVDAKTAYTVHLETYVGLQPDGPYKQSNSPHDVVIRMVEPIAGTNRNVTGDNWFSTYSLTESLKDRGLTYVGTLRRNRREIPLEFLPNKQRTQYSSLFGFQKDKTLVSYCPKKNKSVLLISTMHHDDVIDISTGDAKKPEIITFYNMTKVGVDLVDQLSQKNNVARNTRRWPMVVFYNLLNLAAINAFCIYKFNTIEDKALKRTTFLTSLAWELIKPQIERRCQAPQVPKEIRRRGLSLLGMEETVNRPQEGRKGKRGRCHECGRSRDKSTRKWCVRCDKWTCPDHLKEVCVSCLDSAD